MTNMTETDSDITRDDRDEIVITKGYESITRSYKSITKSYRREREDDVMTETDSYITRSYRRYN